MNPTPNESDALKRINNIWNIVPADDFTHSGERKPENSVIGHRVELPVEKEVKTWWDTFSSRFGSGTHGEYIKHTNNAAKKNGCKFPK